jgi:hypothetical protein
MSPPRVSRLAVLLHVALVAASVYYVTRVANFTPLAELPSPDMIAFSATAAPPLLAAWIGSMVARGEAARRLLACGLALGAAVFAAAFAGVLASDEPLAPLLLILVSVWLAAGYALLLAAVWLVSRSRARGG